MTNPRRGCAKPGGGGCISYGTWRILPLESLKDWSSNGKHKSKVDYWDLIRADISMPNPHIYSIMVIFQDRPLKPGPLMYQRGGWEAGLGGGGTIIIMKIKAITNNPKKLLEKQTMISISQEILSLNYLPFSSEILNYVLYMLKT